MYFAAAYFPEIKNEAFHHFRKKYEPFSDLVPPHVSFIFPVPENIGLKILEQHIHRILKNWEPFDTHFCKLEKTWDHWLFLVPDLGYNEIVSLHDDLYTGLLQPHLRNDLPFIPHIGLGSFSKEIYDKENPEVNLNLDEMKYKKALKEFEALNFEISFTIDSLTILSINRNFTSANNIIKITF